MTTPPITTSPETAHYERLQTLDQLLQERILPGLTPPYITQQNLSQVALRVRKYHEEREAMPMGELYYALPESFFSLLFLKYHCGLPVEKIDQKFWSGCGVYPHLNDEDENRKVKREGIENKFVTSLGLFRAPQKGKILDKEIRQVREKEVLALREMNRQVHGPTEGLLPTKAHLSYIEAAAGLFIADPAAFFTALTSVKFSKGTLSEEEQRFKQEVYNKRCKHISSAVIDTPKPTILDFVNYNYCDASIIPNIFLKWVNPARVEYLDQEIKIAQQLAGLGVTVPRFYGYAISGDNAFLIGEKVNGVDFSTVYYSEDLRELVSGPKLVNPFANPAFVGHFLKHLDDSFPSEPITTSTWKAKVAEAYQELGREVKRLMDVGVYLPDLARRNVMLRYVDRKPQIVPVDFERTQLKEGLSSAEKEQMLERLEKEFQEKALEFEREEFYKGLGGEKSNEKES